MSGTPCAEGYGGGTFEKLQTEYKYLKVLILRGQDYEKHSRQRFQLHQCGEHYIRKTFTHIRKQRRQKEFSQDNLFSKVITLPKRGAQ